MPSPQQPDPTSAPYPLIMDYKKLNPVCAGCPAPAKFIRTAIFSNGAVAIATLCERCMNEERAQTGEAGMAEQPPPPHPGRPVTGGQSHN